MKRLALAALALVLLAACSNAATWTEAERATLRSLSLDSLQPLPADPSNAFASDARAVDLGRRLFDDTRFSGDGTVACSTCHEPQRAYTDGKPLAQGMGTFARNTMTLLGSSYAQWYTWDGKADSQWMQALLPLENPAEHGSDRTAIAHLVAAHYGRDYAAIFGPLPALEESARFPLHASPAGDETARLAWSAMVVDDRDAVNRVFANVGKTLAAYERTLLPAPSRFDAYVRAVEAGDGKMQRALMDADEVAGLRLFMGKARCIDCHNGPLFTNFEFHNTAVPPVAGQSLDHGRAAAFDILLQSEFNCLGAYSDAPAELCSGLRFLVSQGETLDGGFRTPTLRNVTLSAPYMHGGQFATLGEVLRHYDEGGLQMIGHNELSALGLSDAELAQLEAFLSTLTSEPAL